MITSGEKIYYAIKRWGCSYEELSYLLDMERDEVRELYRQEVIKALPKITLNGELTSLTMLSTHTRNALYRHGIKNIRQLITYEQNFSAIRGCGKQSLDEIVEARSAIATVLHLTVPSLIAAFSTGGVNLDVNWMDDEPNNNKVVTKWEVVSSKMTRIESISGRTKGYLKTIQVNVWMN